MLFFGKYHQCDFLLLHHSYHHTITLCISDGNKNFSIHSVATETLLLEVFFFSFYFFIFG